MSQLSNRTDWAAEMYVIDKWDILKLGFEISLRKIPNITTAPRYNEVVYVYSQFLRCYMWQLGSFNMFPSGLQRHPEINQLWNLAAWFHKNAAEVKW